MGNPLGSFIWYELLTTDANAAARFYGDVVGFRIADRPDPNAPGGRDYRLIGRADGGSAGGVMPLSPEMTAGGARPTWLGYLYVPDVDAATFAIVADGGSVVMPKMTIQVGDIAMVKDPLGTPFYVMRPVPPADKPDAVNDVFDPLRTQHVRWNELASPDLARAKAFYASHFGFRFLESMRMGPLGDYCFVDHDSGRLGAIMQKPPADVTPAAWLFYFGVESVAAAERAITAGGGSVILGPHEVPGGDSIVIALDPQGAPFGVVGKKGD